MRLFPMSIAGLAIILASCAPPPGQVGLEPANAQGVSATSVAADGSCNAEIYKDLIGEPIAVVNTLNPGVRVRVLAADAFVTRDFNPNRLTFTTTRQDTVGRVFCG